MDENLGSLMADTARLLRRNFDARARSVGVTRPQWQVLTVLRRMEGVNQGGLADILEVEPITICRMIDRLQEADLVERRTAPADRRSWQLYLTEKAHDLLDQLRPLADDMMAEALDGIAPEAEVHLRKTLDRIRQNLTRRSADDAVSLG